jgi:O-antigen/teichoic acid export membrane protein
MGASFQKSVVPFEILILGAVLGCQTKLFDSFLLSHNKAKINLVGSVIGFILTVVLNFILIRVYGIIGAAIAQTISFFGVFLFIYFAIIFTTGSKNLNLIILNITDIKYMRRIAKKLKP